MDKKQKKKRTPAQIHHHLIQQQKSSQTIKAYCQQNNIHVQAFYSWRKRYKKTVLVKTTPKNTPSKPNVSFTSLGTLNTQVKATALFDICFPDGATVSIYQGTTANEFAPFMSLLTGRK